MCACSPFQAIRHIYKFVIWLNSVNGNNFILHKALCQLVMDYTLCKNGKDLFDQLRPIASALDRCQSDASSPADACDACLGLLLEPALRPQELSTSNSKMPSRSSTSHVAPQVQREADNRAAARCEHMAC